MKVSSMERVGVYCCSYTICSRKEWTVERIIFGSLAIGFSSVRRMASNPREEALDELVKGRAILAGGRQLASGGNSTDEWQSLRMSLEGQCVENISLTIVPIDIALDGVCEIGGTSAVGGIVDVLLQIKMASKSLKRETSRQHGLLIGLVAK